jgi:molybdopterin-biosynthesis enzyme MoeA-like protein
VECVAQLVGVSAYVHEPTIESYMVRRNLTSRDQVTPAMLKMATVPEKSEVFQNPVGWAPCIKCQKGQTTIIIMPGPPKEMEGVFNQHVAPFLSQIYTNKVATLRLTVGMFESEVSPILQKVMQKYPRVYLKAYVAMRQEDGLPVDMVATGSGLEEAEQNLKAALEYLKALVTERGKKVYI